LGHLVYLGLLPTSACVESAANGPVAARTSTGTKAAVALGPRRRRRIHGRPRRRLLRPQRALISATAGRLMSARMLIQSTPTDLVQDAVLEGAGLGDVR
jgi:hypothetical protein